MIKIENVEVTGLEHAIRGMRNPYDSWDKSDSVFTLEGNANKQRFEITCDVGENDLTLMKKLAKAGTDHRKFMRMIVVYADITAPMYWWSEYDTYKVGTVANSCSKMHKLLARPFEMNDFSFDKLPGYHNEIKQFVPDISEEDVANEVWVSYDDVYDVSSLGRVRHNFKNHYRIISGSLHKDGYRFVTLHGKQIPLHRIVAYCFYNDCYKDGLVVNHIDGNKQNNRVNNLEWVTQQENIKHSRENNLQPIQTNNYKGKFTVEQRDEIKRLWDSGELSKRKIAEMYNVSHTCINDIINDKYKYADKVNIYEEVAKPLVDTLNELRDSYIMCTDEVVKKKIWYSVLQLLPESYNQKRTVMLNYEVLSNIYKSRRNHKLTEWQTFCEWIETLPYSELITGKEV
jgi:uncharacterized protein (UPF0248 family)